MKSLLMVAPLLLASACNDSGQAVNRRGEVAAGISSVIPEEASNSDGDIQNKTADSTDYAAPKLVEAKNTAALSAEFKANIGLVSKVAATQIILFGKDGKSWQYNPADDTPPKVLDAVIVKPQGYNLYTLPDGKFWLVGPQTLGRRKAGDAAGGAVPVENFDTSTIKGDWSKVRVLYTAVDTIILQLDTNIAILTIRSGTPSLSQFSSTLPVALEGGIVAAGETEAGGYWFASKEVVALLETQGLKMAWARAKIPLTGHEDYSQVAMRIDSSKKEAVGDILMLQGDQFWSVTGAAIQ